MRALEAYLKVALACRTPFVWCLDRNYVPVNIEHVRHVMPRYGPYEPEVFDCDDFAFAFKGELGHGIGIAINRRHAWNIALATDGVYHIEPQTGEVTQNKRATIVIL